MGRAVRIGHGVYCLPRINRRAAPVELDWRVACVYSFCWLRRHALRLSILSQESDKECRCIAKGSRIGQR
jgi:hypothetical protein